MRLKNESFEITKSNLRVESQNFKLRSELCDKK